MNIVGSRRRLIRRMPTGETIVENVIPKPPVCKSVAVIIEPNRSPLPAPVRVQTPTKGKDTDIGKVRQLLFGKSDTASRTGSASVNWRGSR